MSNSVKFKRREEILKIIGDEKIEKQEELIVELKRKGYNVTQATISRDLKDMNIIRIPESKESYKYVIASKDIFLDRMKSIFKETVEEIDIQEYFVYVKTCMGMAPSVAELIDSMEDARIAGTIAGNNTIFILCRSKENAKKICKVLNGIR